VTQYSAQSTLMNRPCLRLFRGREEHIQDPVSIARRELAQLAGKTSDSGVDTQLMGGAIVQRSWNPKSSFMLVFRGWYCQEICI